MRKTKKSKSTHKAKRSPSRRKSEHRKREDLPLEQSSVVGDEGGGGISSGGMPGSTSGEAILS
jgi:hypothetical protein